MATKRRFYSLTYWSNDHAMVHEERHFSNHLQALHWLSDHNFTPVSVKHMGWLNEDYFLPKRKELLELLKQLTS